MSRRRLPYRQLAAVGAAAAVITGIVAAPPVLARPRTSFYAASVTPGDVKYVTQAANATLVTFTVTNCGAAVAAPSDCAHATGATINSVAITLPSGWTTPDPTTISGLKVAAGDSVNVPLHVMPGVAGAGTAQTVTMCVSDSTACSFQPTGANTTLQLPLRFTFTQSPADGTPAISLCGTKVQLTDAPAGTDTVPLSGVAVRLAPDSGLDPGLSFSVTNTPSTDATGLATFGCEPSPATGGPYRLVAVAQSPAPTVPSDTASAFVVYTDFKACHGSCSSTLTGNGGTKLAASSNATGNLGSSVFGDTDAHFPTFTCTGVKKIDGRPDVLQASADGDKTVVITWSKAVTLKFTDNGTPHWQVCMQAPASFITDSGGAATQSGAYFVGAIPLCGTVPVTNPCMLVSRNQAQEIARITLPGAWAGDPYFH